MLQNVDRESILKAAEEMKLIGCVPSGYGWRRWSPDMEGG
jgi:hypothetical protein